MALRRRATTPAPSGAGVSRRELFSLGARRVLPDEDDVAAIGEALRQFHDAEAGIDHEASAERAEQERAMLAERLDRARASWGRGDMAAQARALAPAADTLVAAAGIQAGSSVLDVGAGDGTVALAAAAAGARVTALDQHPSIVAQGRVRCAREGLEVAWCTGDATALPFADDTFDCALSGFGVIFAPRPRDVVAELRRVTRPDGVIAVTAWASTGLMGRVLDLIGGLVEAPPGAVRPSRWGRYESAFLWMERAVSGFEMTDHELIWEFSSVGAAVDALMAAPGPLGAALDEADEASRAGARSRLGDLVRSFDTSEDPTRVRLDVGYAVLAGRAIAPAAS